jgi:hypothetical protein
MVASEKGHIMVIPVIPFFVEIETIGETAETQGYCRKTTQVIEYE